MIRLLTIFYKVLNRTILKSILNHNLTTMDINISINILGSITVTPTSKAHQPGSQNDSFGYPNTNLTPSSNQNVNVSNFKSPLSTNVSISKSTKAPHSATEYPEEISFLLQRPGIYKNYNITTKLILSN